MTESNRAQRPSPINGVSLSPAPKGNLYHEQHGLNTLKKHLSKLGNRAIDGRSKAAVALRKWRQEIIEDLGGLDTVSAQETILDLACRTRLLLHSVDAWLFEQETLINKKKKMVFPVVVQRQQLADGLAKYMSMLGLERRHKVKSLSEILSQSEPEAKANTTATEQASTPPRALRGAVVRRVSKRREPPLDLQQF